MSAPRHFLDLDALDSGTLRSILDLATDLRDDGARRLLEGKVLAMIFEEPSTRTRVSFDVAMRKLGGSTIVLHGHDMQVGRGESVADTARALSRYVDGIVIRAPRHAMLLELAASAEVPVINGLTDATHPCQLMADVMTFERHRGPIAGRVVAWSGDGNNVAVSWIHAAVRFDFELRVACPEALRPPPDVLAWAEAEAGRVVVTEEPEAAWPAPIASLPTPGCRCATSRARAATICSGPIRLTSASWDSPRPTPSSCTAYRRTAARRSPPM